MAKQSIAIRNVYLLASTFVRQTYTRPSKMPSVILVLQGYNQLQPIILCNFSLDRRNRRTDDLEEGETHKSVVLEDGCNMGGAHYCQRGV